jgi:Regulator of chromosome condensation (RCC1) repeat
MNRPLFSALALLTLTLAACGQPTSSERPLSAPTASLAPNTTQSAGVTLRIPAPSGLSAQYVNQNKTTRVDVQIDGAAATSYTLGSAQAPCAGGFCTITLGKLSPASHTFAVSTYGMKPADGSTVLISQGSATQTLAAGQNTNVALTLTPVGNGLALKSVVQQYNSATKTYGNYTMFITLAGHSSPAYYDIQGIDSVGDVIPGTASVNALVCSTDSNVVITKVNDSTNVNRYRVEMTATGAATLSVNAGTDCVVGSPVASQAISGANSTIPSTPIHKTITGGYQYAAIKPDGSVIGWGGSVPSGITTAVALADNSASDHGMALKGDGTIAYWGYGSNNVTATPTGLTGIVEIGAGFEHSVALLSDGTVRAWGGGIGGSSTVPAGLNSVVSISSGYGHILALKSDGTVVGWGQNTNGQTTAPAGLSGVTAVTAGQNFSLALKSDGTVVGWGLNTSGQTTVPAGLTNVIAVAAGSSHALALKSDGTVVGWGLNSSGQATVPAGLTNVIAIAGGTNTSLALKQDGSIVSWGAVAAPATVTSPGSVLP